MTSPQGICSRRRPKAAASAFSLIELLVAVGVVTALVALLFPALRGASNRAREAQCLARMRALGSGITAYAQNEGEFPRSLHSAAGAGAEPWARAILPYLGSVTQPTDSEWRAVFERSFRCPADKNRGPELFSYGLNVYFELTPDGDDYDGSPATWRKPANVERPGATILLAEPKPVYFADHIMSHQWTSAAGASNAVDGKRHATRSNFFFVDGHVEALPVSATFDPAKKINLWNPGLAARR